MAQKPTKNTADSETNEKLLKEAQDNEVATTRSQAPALTLGKVNIEETEEELAASGSMPVLKTAFGVGTLSDEGHAPGNIVLGDYLLGKKGDEFTIFALGVSYYWKEGLEYIPGVRQEPQRLPTAEAVRALGKTTEWSGPQGSRKRPDFEPAADFILLIRQPEGVISPHFSYRLNGEAYAMARYYTDKNTYRFSGDPIVRATKGAPYPFSVEFTFTTANKRLGQQNTVMPFTRLNGMTDPGLMEELVEHFANNG